jgi:hypothetical protein
MRIQTEARCRPGKGECSSALETQITLSEG